MSGACHLRRLVVRSGAEICWTPGLAVTHSPAGGVWWSMPLANVLSMHAFAALSSTDEPRTAPAARRMDVAFDVESAWRRFAPMVHRRCFSMLRDTEEARDATQEVFVKLVLHKARLTDDAPASLLWTMATRECLTRLRRRRRRPETPGDELLMALAAVDDPEREVSVHRTLETLFSTTAEPLRATTRTLAVWHWVDGMTLQEVAEAAKMSVSGVRKRLRTLKERVAQLHPELRLPEVAS